MLRYYMEVLKCPGNAGKDPVIDLGGAGGRCSLTDSAEKPPALIFGGAKYDFIFVPLIFLSFSPAFFA